MRSLFKRSSKCSTQECFEAREILLVNECICNDLKELENKEKIDGVVWEMMSCAHRIIEMEKELKLYYPEMITFLNYLVTTYPALYKKNK